MNNVFFYEAFEEEREAIKSLLPSTESAAFTYKTIQEYGTKTPPAPIISVRTQSMIPQQWASSLQAVLSRSTGYDHLDTWRRNTKADIPYGYLPKYCARAVAEHAMLLWTALLRKFPRQRKQFMDFDRDGLTGAECAGRTILVVGVGNIGSEIVQLAQALGMHVIGVDITPKLQNLEYAAFGDSIATADVIVCAMNLTNENRNYFNFDALSQAKKGAVFVNVARGEHTNAPDLIRLLNEGVLGGVGLDVFEEEPTLITHLREKSPEPRTLPETVWNTLALANRTDVIVTPHNAFNSVEAVHRKAEQSVQQIQHLRQHGTFLWSVPR